MNKKIIGAIVAAVAIYLAFSTMYTVDETEHVVVTEFGAVKETVSEPGLQFKMPWHSLLRFEKRILASDSPPSEYLTEDKKRLVADPVIRWRIAGPVRFYERMTSVTQARSRLDDIVLSELRDELAERTMGDMVGSARTGMMANVTERTRKKAEEYGIDVVDVRIKHLDLPKEVQQSVFARMRAERQRLAKGYRAQGQEASDRITAKTDKEVQIVLAKARKRADELRGTGDAESTKIYAEAYDQDPEFYSFTRNLEVYDKSIDDKATIVLSTDSKLFRYLTQSGSATNGGPGGP